MAELSYIELGGKQIAFVCNMRFSRIAANKLGHESIEQFMQKMPFYFQETADKGILINNILDLFLSAHISAMYPQMPIIDIDFLDNLCNEIGFNKVYAMLYLPFLRAIIESNTFGIGEKMKENGQDPKELFDVIDSEKKSQQ